MAHELQYRGQIGTALPTPYDAGMAPLLKVRRATVSDEFELFALVRLFPTPTSKSPIKIPASRWKTSATNLEFFG